ncbi:ATP-binding protein [Lyngbya sp. CCY1209]|uniref:sensor histidine kinase n=1 Tax=Lyngbya sp. CCY1209 TaxID=2886103 RepID=UPI002D21000C|nr:ATP-binding protein [Lyngbya sp. CCY1209]MEB3882345.1 two-component sensor histidine kinase [Lyngbya sp. CCY1209]
MKMIRRIAKTGPRFWVNLPPISLQVQLTFGIVAFAVVGLGGVTAWTSWNIRQLLVEQHKEKLAEFAQQFSHDVKLYSEMMPREVAVQRVIDKPSEKKSLVWVKNRAGEIIAESVNLRQDIQPNLRNALISYSNMPKKPGVSKIDGRYWVLCGGDFTIGSYNFGKLYMVNDITSEYKIFITLLYRLVFASLFAMILLVSAIAWYIRRSLLPLQQVSRMAATISAAELSDYRLTLERAPSEVEQLANTCNKMLDRLADAWEQQRQFVGNVSHELRTPLTIVHGYLQSTLRRGENLTQLQREGLETASGEAERTIRLLQDLLELARADHGTLHLQLEPIIVNDLMAEVVEMAQSFSRGRIKLEKIDGFLEIKADKNRLKQVLLNLIDNALKYSQADTPILLKADRHKNRVDIAVCDRGPGIPLSHQSRIFERFYRVDEARTRAGGTGLGLAIVKTLVEGMGGTVGVRSQLGEGSTFIVCFPDYL